jgi:hypothetical protein
LRLACGERQRFEVQVPVPITAHPTLKLTDNEILWASELRVDIPKWPDWVKEIPFVVKPEKQLRFKLVFSIQNFYLNNELNLIFNDLYINNLERITLCVNFNINKKLYSRLVGSSKEDFLKNFLYFWSY